MKKINQQICNIAIPAAIETLFTTIAGIIDSKMVSALGLNAIAAISVTNQPKLFILCFFFSINSAISALVAKQMGRKDREKANEITLTAMSLVVMGAVIMGLFCVLLAKPIMIICSNQPETMADSVLYFRIIMGAMIFNVVSMAINSAFRGCGYTKLTLISNIASCVINIFLNYLLIDGHLGAPALGVLGAAIATVSGTVAAMIISIAFAFKHKNFVNIHFCRENRIRPSRSSLAEICGMWKRIFAEDIFTRIGFLVTGIIAARAGAFAMSVYSVSMHLLNINFAFGSGLSTAAIALVGKSYGEENKEAILLYSRLLLKFGTVVSLVLAAIYIPFSGLYYGLFNSDPQFIKVGILSCLVISALAPIQNRQIVYNGIFRAVGDVKYTLRAAVISVTLVNTGVSFVATILLSLGIWGIWAGAFANQTIRMLMLRRRYRRNYINGEEK